MTRAHGHWRNGIARPSQAEPCEEGLATQWQRYLYQVPAQVFHNLKGFDGVLTTNSLYKQNLKVTEQLGTGTKMLHFKHENLIFKDSLSFLSS